MGDLTADSSNSVTFEIFPNIYEEDFDLLILYLESRKQSGGGDIINIESLNFNSLQDTKKLKISYEDAEVAQRMLSKKFFKFKNYHLRSFRASSYKEDSYEKQNSKLIIRNIPIDSQEDNSIIQMYAEYLAPDNDIIDIQKSLILKDSFCVTYDHDLNKEQLIVRYNKKPKLRNKQITLSDSFNTNSFIIFSKDKTTQDFSQIITKLSSELNQVNYFMEYTDKYVLYQFENEKLLNELYDSTRLLIDSNNFGIEIILNFEILTEAFSQTSAPVVNKKDYSNKMVDIGVQTDLIVPENLIDFIPPQNGNRPIVKDKNHVKNSRPSSIRSSISESSSCISSNYSNNTYDPVIQLDTNEFYSIALMNTKQLFINFQDELKKSNKSLELVHSLNRLLIRNNGPIANNDWKVKVMVTINDFFEKRALYKLVEIPTEIFQCSIKIQNLKEKLAEFNKHSSAYFFRILNQNVECFGCKRALQDKLNDLHDYLKSLPTLSVIPKNEPVKVVKNQCDDKYEIASDSLSFFVIWNIKQLMHDFKNNIKNLNADLQILSDEKKIFLTRIQSPDPDWRTRIRNFLIDYEKNQIQRTNLTIPQKLRNEKDIESLNNFLKKNEKSMNTIKMAIVNNTLQITGYIRAVDKLAKMVQDQFFKNMNGNVKQRVESKLEIVITRETKLIEYEVLKEFNGKYFQELSNRLKSVRASLAAYHVNSKDKGFKIFANLNESELNDEAEVNKWIETVKQCKKEFFGKFSKKTFPSSSLKLTKIEYDRSLACIKYFGPMVVQVLGISSEVEKICEQFGNKPKEITKENKSVVEEKETFLINDLHWFQTKILFEKQYFKSLADNFKDLNVLLDTQLTRICFTGSKSDIEQAKNLAFDILGKILGAEVECDALTLKKMTQNENLYSNLIREKKLCCVIDTKSHDDRFTIYTTDMTDLEKCKTVLSKFKF